MMKKLLLVLAFVGVAMGSFAQDATPVQQYSVSTNSFWSNWFFQVGADWNAWYSAEEHGHGLAHSPFKKFRSNPGVSVALGKWFTPGIGLRTKVQGIWGKSVDADWNDATNEGNGNKYWILNEQVLFNLSNLFCGYNENRVWNVTPFIGAGFGRSMSYNRYAMDMNIGIQSSWKVGKKTRIYAEAGWNRLENDINGAVAGGAGNTKGGWDSHTNNIYAEVGISFGLGKSTWKKTPDVDAIYSMHQSELDALNAQLNDAQAENERLQELLKNQKPVKEVVKEIVATPVSVFFNLGKSKIANKRDLVNVQALADYAKDHNLKLIVNGYADSDTGSAKVNQKLSEKRAQAVVDQLKKMGVDESKIESHANGGVSELSPSPYNRRATVMIAE